jgi:hypothetical protein
VNIATQAQVLRAIRQRLIDTLGLPESRVYLTNDPVFAEGMDFVVQISPIAVGATNELNRAGLGFVTERFSVTTFVRTASDNDVKKNRQLTGESHGVLYRQTAIRQALIQHDLGGMLAVPIRFVSSGPVKEEPRTQMYLAATDVFICSYALAWPVAGIFRFGWRSTQPTWAQLSEERSYANSTRYSITTPTRSGTPASEYLWFAFPAELHSLGVEIRTAAGLEPFYRTGFPPPSGPAIGTLTQAGVTYHLYRRAFPTTAASLTYDVRAG